MSPLEQAIEEAVSNDRLDGLTLWPSRNGWQANARFAGSSGWRCVKNADPVAALLGALDRPAPETKTASAGVFD